MEAEITLMEYSEKAIFEIQKIFTSKLGGGYCTLKKAMEIEDWLYKDALYQVDEQIDNVWESLETLQYYKASIDRIKKLMNERSDKDTDWVKLFNIKDVKNFRQQLTRAVHTQVNKRKAPAEPNSSHFSIPAPNIPGIPAGQRQQLPPTTTGTGNKTKGSKTTKKGKKQQKTKKAKAQEAEIKDRMFQQDWVAKYNAADSSVSAPTSTASASASVTSTSTAAISSASASASGVISNNTSASAPGGRGSGRGTHTTTSPVEERKQQKQQKEKEKDREKAREKEREMPMMTHLMHQDSTSSLSEAPELHDQDSSSMLFLDAQGDDSFFATATLENASEWGGNQNKNNTGEDSQQHQHQQASSSSSSSSGWSTAISERKSHVQHTEAQLKHQSLAQDARRRATEESYTHAHKDKDKDGEQGTREQGEGGGGEASAAAAEEELRLARAREREKRERELQGGQNVFMDGDHEALGGEMYW